VVKDREATAEGGGSVANVLEDWMAEWP